MLHHAFYLTRRSELSKFKTGLAGLTSLGGGGGEISMEVYIYQGNRYITEINSSCDYICTGKYSIR